MNKQFIITNFAAFALMLFLPTGCRQADGKQDAVQSYRVIKVAASPVEISESYSAAIRGRQDVDILPQISGRIIRLKVKEGERVKTGQVLAVIDQVPYRAALRTAQANVSAAQAKVETARIELRGKQALFDEKVISDYELSLARNQLAVACAELEQAKAQESDARNNLSYTEIKSPSNGVVGTLPYRIGALVGPNMAQPFTVVSDNAEMYAYFSISENMLRRYLARYGSIDSMIAGMPEVGLQLNDGSLYKAKGRIETVSGVVDPVTGTVQIKALFPNPDRELLSGSIGNVILQNPKTEAVTIPMTATVELQDKIIAYRLKNGQAEAAYLTVDRLNDGNRFIVKEGLSVGDTIVAEGVGTFRVVQVVQNALFTSRQHPFINRFMKDVIEDTTECTKGISTQLCQFFHCLYFLIVLNNEVLETVYIFREWMHQTRKIIIGIIVSQYKRQFFSFQR